MFKTNKHFILLALLLLIACETVPPQPFPQGQPTAPPEGCTVLRERNGEC